MKIRALCLALLASSAVAQTAPPRVTLPQTLAPSPLATFTVATSKSFALCWRDDAAADRIVFTRYRVEGGPRETLPDFPRSQWVASSAEAGVFCKPDVRLSKAGHWVFEASLCAGAQCSEVGSSACETTLAGCSGSVGSNPRGWWVYVFIPPVGGIGVN
jgi:hypothetical protein